MLNEEKKEKTMIIWSLKGEEESFTEETDKNRSIENDVSLSLSEIHT